MKVKASRIIAVLLAAAILLSGVSAAFGQDDSPRYMKLSIEGTITAGTLQFLEDSFERAENEGYDGFIILLDTPGGLVDPTLEMMKRIGNSSIPVITYVAPTNAIAASAGTFLLISGHVAAMSPGTTCGAAMPVAMTPGTGETGEADDKTVQFLAGHMKSVARQHDRPEDVVERFVTENLTLTSGEALEAGVIEFEEAPLESLMESLHGHTVTVDGRQVTMQTRDAVIEQVDMTASQRLSHFISNPQVAFLLLMLGMYGIIFGLSAPGTIIPEVGGAVALILALFGLGMFEASTLGVVLIVIAVIFFIAEVFTPTFGILTGAGVVSLVLGGFFLPVEPLLPQAWFQVFQVTVLSIAAVTVAFLLLVVTKLVKLRKSRDHFDSLGMKGYRGVVLAPLSPKGTVRIRGEIWNAKSVDGTEISPDSQIEVVDTSGMTLLVRETGSRDESENTD